MSFVVQLPLELAEPLRQGLESQGFALTTPPYTLFQGKKRGIACTLYCSGKLVVQGSESKEFIQFYLEPEILHTFTFDYPIQQQALHPHIGVDESGKGDFFGPLCIAGVYADVEGIHRLVSWGVKDSKQLSDATILSLADKIKKAYAYQLVQINPKRYNELYEQFKNLNLLLGWGHATVITQLFEQTACAHVIIDQFADEQVVINALRKKQTQVQLTQRTKGESDVVVAAASIVARAAFVEGLKQLGEHIQQKLPKGSGEQTVAAGRALVRACGPAILAEVGKLHFKTRECILE